MMGKFKRGFFLTVAVGALAAMIMRHVGRRHRQNIQDPPQKANPMEDTPQNQADEDREAPPIP